MIESVGCDCSGELIDLLILLIESLVETLLVGCDDVGDRLVCLGKRRLNRGLECREMFFQISFDGFLEESGGFVDDGGSVFANERSDVFLRGGEKELFELFGLFFCVRRHGSAEFSSGMVEFVPHGLKLVEYDGLELVGSCLECSGE